MADTFRCKGGPNFKGGHNVPEEERYFLQGIRPIDWCKPCMRDKQSAGRKRSKSPRYKNTSVPNSLSVKRQKAINLDEVNDALQASDKSHSDVLLKMQEVVDLFRAGGATAVKSIQFHYDDKGTFMSVDVTTERRKNYS